MKSSNEARVGVVVLAALALALAGYFYFRGMSPNADVYYLQVNGPANIAEGNDVRLQGVKIGSVRDVSLDPATQQPVLTLAIKRGQKLAQNYEYSIRTNGLVGEPYVDVRGAYNPDADIYAANDESQVIRGRSLASIAEVTDQAANVLNEDFRKTLQNLNVTIDRINKGVLSYQNQIKLARALEGVAKLSQQASKGFDERGIKVNFGDPRAQAGLNRTFENAARAANDASVAARSISTSVERLTGNASQVSGNLNNVITENRRELRGLLTNFNATARNVAGLTESLNFIVRGSGLQENSQLAIRSLRRAAENVESGTAGFKAIAGDASTQKNLRDTVDALRVTTEALRDTAVSINSTLNDPTTQVGLRGTLTNIAGASSNIEKATSNLAEISEAFKNTIADPQLQNNLKETAENLNGTLAATRAAAERVNRLLGGRDPRKASDDNGEKSSDGENKVKKREAKAESEFSGFDANFTLRHLNAKNDNNSRNSDGYFGDLTLNADLFSSPFRLGISDIGEDASLTAQGGTYVGDNIALRGGLYRGKLGVGAEFRKGRFSLEGNAWDPNRSSHNIYAGFKLTPNFEILAGRENIRGVHSNAIGVRLRP